MCQELVKHQFVCKIRGRHTSNPADLKTFKADPSNMKETFCEGCGSPLELERDSEDHQLYRTKEF